MAKSQFEKRKAKEAITDVPKSGTNAPEVGTDPVVEVPAPVEEYNQFAYDIYLDKDNRTFQLVTLKYNSETKKAVVAEIKPIDRAIGLSHGHSKRALTTLKDR